MREWRDLFIKFAMSCFSFFITKEFNFKNRHKKSTTWCNFKRENLRITTKKASFCLRKNGRGERIRTFDLMFPKHARYQAAPHPVATDYYNILYKKSFVKYFIIFLWISFYFCLFFSKESINIIPQFSCFVKYI